MLTDTLHNVFVGRASVGFLIPTKRLTDVRQIKCIVLLRGTHSVLKERQRDGVIFMERCLLRPFLRSHLLAVVVFIFIDAVGGFEIYSRNIRHDDVLSCIVRQKFE